MRGQITDGAQAVANLMLAHPDLPVLKMGGDGSSGDDSDAFVLKLRSAWLGEYVCADDAIYDDPDDVRQGFIEEAYDIGLDDSDGYDDIDADAYADAQLAKCPRGNCIWVRMDYFDPEEEGHA